MKDPLDDDDPGKVLADVTLGHLQFGVTVWKDTWGFSWQSEEDKGKNLCFISWSDWVRFGPWTFWVHTQWNKVTQ